MTKKKTLILIISSLIAIIAATLIANSNSYTEITTACVNDLDGDISFAYFSGSGIFVKSYNKEGEQLFSKYFNSDGGSAIYMEYIGSNLCIYVARTDEVFIYDDDMEYVSKSSNSNLYNLFVSSLEKTNWNGWNSSWNSKKCLVKDLEYCYEESSFLLGILNKGECKLYIHTSNNEQIVLYHSTSN